jgi:putative transposase
VEHHPTHHHKTRPTGANVHDTKRLEKKIDSIVIDRPETSEKQPQHLCLNKGRDTPTGRTAAVSGEHISHIRRIDEEKLDATRKKPHKSRRWVVERTLAWLSKCRAILVRYTKKSSNDPGIIQLASALLSYRRQQRWSV